MIWPNYWCESHQTCIVSYCKQQNTRYHFLGVSIDPLLNFKYHIDTITKKWSKSLHFLRNAINSIHTKKICLLLLISQSSDMWYSVFTYGEVLMMQKFINFFQTKIRSALLPDHGLMPIERAYLNPPK